MKASGGVCVGGRVEGGGESQWWCVCVWGGVEGGGESQWWCLCVCVWGGGRGWR